MVNLKILLSSFSPEVNVKMDSILKYNTDPIIINGVLKTILRNIDELNNNEPSRNLVEAGPYNKFMSYFPAITTRFK